MKRRFKLLLLIPLLADCAHTALPRATEPTQPGHTTAPAGGRTPLPAGYTASKTLMNNFAKSPIQGAQLVLEPYQAVVLELKKAR